MLEFHSFWEDERKGSLSAEMHYSLQGKCVKQNNDHYHKHINCSRRKFLLWSWAQYFRSTRCPITQIQQLPFTSTMTDCINCGNYVPTNFCNYLRRTNSAKQVYNLYMRMYCINFISKHLERMCSLQKWTVLDAVNFYSASCFNATRATLQYIV